MNDTLKEFAVEKISVRICSDKESLGVQAARYAAGRIKDILSENEIARIIFATGASQFEFISALIRLEIDWNRVHAFHLDEYVNLPDGHPASFRLYLKERLFDQVKPAKVHYLDGNAPDLEKECERYSALLTEGSIHLACIGIGENGHIAFNDPPVADFADPKWVKVVELDEACRRQQMGEGWFPAMDDVPTHALTQTVSSIMRSECISCVVPDERKAEAVYNALHGGISTSCPASILRTHPNAILWLDPPAASKL